MKNTRKLYLVGDKNSLKTNQWLAVTPYMDEAIKLVDTMPAATRWHKVEVKV